MQVEVNSRGKQTAKVLSQCEVSLLLLLQLLVRVEHTCAGRC